MKSNSKNKPNLEKTIKNLIRRVVALEDEIRNLKLALDKK